MSRLPNPAIAEATGKAAQLFTAIKGAIGMVPAAFSTLGHNSAAALEAALALDGAVKKASLSAAQVEVVKLVVSEHAACDYCLGAHTMMGKKAGLGRDAILALRHGQPSGDAGNDALAAFTRTIVGTSGDLPDAALAAVRAAGFSDTQLADLAMTIASITFTNVFNRINATVLDFPAAD